MEQGWLGLPESRSTGDNPKYCQMFDERRTLSWWIARVPTLTPEERNGWVLSLIMEEFTQEQHFVDACSMKTFEQRMIESGMQSLLDVNTPPRKRCSKFQVASDGKVALAEERAQRLMLQAISKSIPSYMSGIRCWAAFCDAMQVECHFPATQSMVLKYTAMFGSHATMMQYLKHLRWGHRFFHLANGWDTPVVTQALNGLRKESRPPRKKLSLVSSEVASIVGVALRHNDRHVAALCAIARLFLLRVPSEGIPLEWSGAHSSVELCEMSASITLMTRKNLLFPSTLTRHCCCLSAGRKLCAIHWLHWLRKEAGEGQLFPFSARTFISRVRAYASELQMPDAMHLGTHAFRRGMAQDIVSHGGSLAILLRAGDWTSKAFMTYLRDSQIQDEAVSQLVINASDSEPEDQMAISGHAPH
jgi:hypothetical protein